MGDYLRDFDALMSGYGLTGLPYGHFGDGCLHIRIDFPLQDPGGTAVFREFLLAAGQLWQATAGHCRASTVTAGPAASCSR
jgi:FAD/FMN-containing dehydrogenase